MCKCEKCGRPAACGEKYCEQCEIQQEDVRKNLDAGGRFYGEKLIKEA